MTPLPTMPPGQRFAEAHPKQKLEFTENSLVRNIPATCMHYVGDSNMLF
jgi:hypothetical protein